MKKNAIGPRLAAGLLALALLAGCAGHEAPKQETPLPPDVAEEPDGIDAPAPGDADDADDAPETPDTEPETPLSTLPALLASAQPVDGSGALRHVACDAISENLMQEIALFGDQLLCYCTVFDAQTNADQIVLRLVSLETGELTAQTQVQSAAAYAAAVQVCGDRVALSDAQGGTIYVLDEQLREVARYEVSGDAAYVDPALTRAYCVTDDGVQCVELATGQTQSVLSGVRELTAIARSGSDLALRYIDLSTAGMLECWAALDLETGALTPFPADVSLSGTHFCAGVWTAQVLGEDVYVLGTQQALRCFALGSSYPLVSLSGAPARLTVMTTENDGVQSLAAYDTDGTFLSAFSTEPVDATLTSAIAWLDGGAGALVIAIDATGHDQLYYWDLTAQTAGEDLVLTDFGAQTTPDGEALEQTYYDRARTIAESYGLRLKIADQCRTDYGDKTAALVCDAGTVSAGLDALEAALSCYPDGFFSQLRYGACRVVEVALVGEIAEKEPIEGHASSAFVQDGEGNVTMVLNISYDAQTIEENFHHETAHIIDRLLAHDARYREDALYAQDDWWALNPASFRALAPENGGYYDSYAIMPMEYYQEEFSSCFVIDYGKTFATEDRATIFAAAMQGNTARFAAAAPLRAKLDYYSRCIRDCFDTTGWPETTRWEATLKNAGGA